MPANTRSTGQTSARSSGKASGTSRKTSGKASGRSGKAAPKGGGARRAGRTRAEERRRSKLARMRARSGSRWRIHYDIDGPRVRLGILWFVGAMVAFTVGLTAVVLYFGVAFAAAAAHSLRTWRARGHPVDPRIALCATAVVVASAGFGPRIMGVAVLVLAAGSLAWGAVAPAGRPDRSRGRRGSDEGADLRGTVARAGLLLQTTLPTAVAGGSLVLLADREIWSAISLVLIVSAYETGDFLIGSGSTNSVEGPVAGFAAVVVMSLAVAASGVAFESVVTAMVFGVAIAPLAFAGQMLASAVLPHARAFAPALRRVDSLLLAAPLWYVGLDRLVL